MSTPFPEDEHTRGGWEEAPQDDGDTIRVGGTLELEVEVPSSAIETLIEHATTAAMRSLLTIDD